jgi:hypothetical protein
METAQAAGARQDRQRRLTAYLKADPENLALLADAAEAALGAGDLRQAYYFLRRYLALRPLPSALLNLRGLVALYELSREMHNVVEA